MPEQADRCPGCTAADGKHHEPDCVVVRDFHAEDWQTVEEVAARLRISPRWLADECRAGRVEHVHMARKRFFTRQQVAKLIAQHIVRSESDVKLDKVRERARRAAFPRPDMGRRHG